jgi:DNA (cytosine-5)-methyltransferase 1
MGTLNAAIKKKVFFINGFKTKVMQPTVVHGTQDPCVSDIAFAQGRNNGGENVLIQSMAVRRLTPVECERLQGFSDNYTNIPWRKADESPDGPRYKSLGNSMAVPVMSWIGKRIEMVNKNLNNED